MAILCSECKEPTYEVVDMEKDVKDRVFVLLECRKCRRCIIVPEREWIRENQAAPQKSGAAAHI